MGTDYLSQRIIDPRRHALAQAMTKAEGDPTVFDALMSGDGFRNVGHVGGVGGYDIYQTINYGPSINSEAALGERLGERRLPLNSMTDKLMMLDQSIKFMNDPNAFPGHEDILHQFIGGRSVEDLKFERNEKKATQHELRRLQGRDYYESGFLSAENLEEWFPL